LPRCGIEESGPPRLKPPMPKNNAAGRKLTSHRCWAPHWRMMEKPIRPDEKARTEPRLLNEKRCVQIFSCF